MENNFRIVVKFPTRNRPDKFKEVFLKYIEMLSGKNSIRFVVSLDFDDITMNNQSIKDWFEKLKLTNDIKYCYGNCKTKVEACNADMEGEQGDVLILASDDMVPQQIGYDEIIINNFKEAFPDFFGAIKYWDGYQSKETNLLTFPVIGFPLYKKIGYLYNPLYKSTFCDDDLTYVCGLLGKLAKSDLCIAKHEWKPGPWDELHARNISMELHFEDQATFSYRKSINFGI